MSAITQHHGTAMYQHGGGVYDNPWSQTEPKIRELRGELSTKHGQVLVVIDHPKTTSTLVVAVAVAVAVAEQMDILPANIQVLTMRRVADLPPGPAKVDARDAYIIAETLRTMPYTLCSITVAEQ